MLAVIKVLVSCLTFFWFMTKTGLSGLISKISDKSGKFHKPNNKKNLIQDFNP